MDRWNADFRDMNYMPVQKEINMRLITVIFCLVLSIDSFSQLGAHDVLQTYKGKDLNALQPIDGNPIIKKIVQKRKGIEVVNAEGEKTFKVWDDIETINFGHNEYHLDMDLNGMSLSILYKPYPYTSSEQILQYGIVKVPDSLNASSLNYYKIIFLKDLVIE